MGFIDMRRVIAIRESSKGVAFDGSRNAVNGLMHKLRGMMGKSTLDRVARPVLELVTSNRVYTLCPATVDMPAPMNVASAVGPSMYGKPLYLFGWPFPVPPLEGAVVSPSDVSDDEDVEALKASDEEAQKAANAMLAAAEGDAVSTQSASRTTLHSSPTATQGFHAT